MQAPDRALEGTVAFVGFHIFIVLFEVHAGLVWQLVCRSKCTAKCEAKRVAKCGEMWGAKCGAWVRNGRG